jgi:hypothetical protein
MAVNYNTKSVTDGLVNYLDAANTKSYPASGNTFYDLTGINLPSNLLNGVAYSTSNFGILNLDGTDDSIKFPFDLSYVPALSNFTLEMWVRITSFPSALASPNVYGYKRKAGVLMGSAYYSGVAFYWNGNETGTEFGVYGYIRGNDGYRITSAYNFLLNQWTHLVLVNNYSSSLLQYYVNGSLHNQVSGPTENYNATLAPIAENIGISKPQVDGGGEYNYSYVQCNCALAKVYKKALSSQEVIENYTATRGRFGI